MEYEAEELVPIVSALAEKYTSKESSSITYEKAQQFVLMSVIAHILSGKSLDESDFDSKDYMHMQEILRQEDLHDLQKKLKNIIEAFVQDYYEHDRELLEYLYKAVDNIAVRLKKCSK